MASSVLGSMDNTAAERVASVLSSESSTNATALSVAALAFTVVPTP